MKPANKVTQEEVRFFQSATDQKVRKARMMSDGTVVLQKNISTTPGVFAWDSEILTTREEVLRLLRWNLFLPFEMNP